MGAANVIPGVSGGTIALITGIFERLINAIKSLNINALRLLWKGRFKELMQYTDFYFLLAVGIGILIAVFSIARLFEYLFSHYPVYIWSYFFGLILASVYFVGRTIKSWTIPVVISFATGITVAVSLSFLHPATENTGFVYLILCGIAGICSMILPGISGSFVLILMGNYHLIAIDAINNLRLDILLPFGIGIIIGLIGFSHLLSWIYRRFRYQTIATLTGFILGSLVVIWPWKTTVFAMDKLGNVLLKAGKPVVARYQLTFPESLSTEVVFAAIFMILGVASIAIIESLASKNQN